MPTVFAKTLLFTAAVLGLSVAAATGCSDDEENATTPRLDSGPFCPATIAAALDPKTTCLGEGFECPIGYACGPINQQAYCRCEKGKFTCKTGRGEAIDSAESPKCTPQGSGSEKECPGSQNGTDGTQCKVPGLQCHYRGFTCPETPDTPKIDVCQCVSGAQPDGGPTLQWRCEIKYCNPKSDASIPIFDAGQD
jgi:hypothetical protein